MAKQLYNVFECSTGKLEQLDKRFAIKGLIDLKVCLPIVLAVVDFVVTGDGDDRLLTTTTRTTPPVISTSRTAPPVIGTARASSPVFTATGQCARIKEFNSYFSYRIINGFPRI